MGNKICVLQCTSDTAAGRAFRYIPYATDRALLDGESDESGKSGKYNKEILPVRDMKRPGTHTENAKKGGQKKPHCDAMIQEVIELIDQMEEEND